MDDVSSQTGKATSGEMRHKSLEEIHGTIAVPEHTAGFWRQYRAFAGPAILV